MAVQPDVPLFMSQSAMLTSSFYTLFIVETMKLSIHFMFMCLMRLICSSTLSEVNAIVD
jgi:hypothetical protein